MPDPVPTGPDAQHVLGRDLAAVAVELAEGAGALVREARAGGFEVGSKSTATDLVTEIDRRSEAWLVDEIARRRPGDGVLGEEGAGRDGTTAVRWVIDPIDGTVNFVLGIPHYAVSVAAELTIGETDGETGGTAGETVVVAGAVHDVALGETFHAAVGGGAWLGDTRLTGPREVVLEQAVVGTGFGYDAALRERQATAIGRVGPRVADIRRLGSAALALCYVAAGRLDAYFEAGLHAWDRAAGALIASEAGCVVGGVGDEPASRRLTVAAGPALTSGLSALLAETGADRVL